MGHIIMLASSFVASLSEDAGARSGFALTREDLVHHLSDENVITNALVGGEKLLRVGSSDYEDMVGDMLYALGVAEQKGMPTLGQRLIQRIGSDWRSVIDISLVLKIEAVANHYLRMRNVAGLLDRSAFTGDVDSILSYGVRSVIFDDLIEVMSLHLAHCPWFTRVAENIDLVSLSNLFESELLPVGKGEFFDQRFINYLSRWPDLLQEINWRQFEGLAAEWLSRNGYEIKLGAGRNDGGIDVRAWRKGEGLENPPAVIVQCKREKRKIGKVVVKALWADVYEERADSGLIVTTNDISPGAVKMVEARAYPVTTANRTEVQRWIHAMREPKAGLIL